MPRIKANKGEIGLYHCMSRIVSGDFLLGAIEREMLVQLMWELADFLGVEILDYAVMGNHYHQLVLVPREVKLSDIELLHRLRRYYGPRSTVTAAFERAISKGGKLARSMRNRHLRRMGDISEFEKILKQRFTAWYNRRNRRKGTLWMERFKSVLVENSYQARSIVAAYIDLNPVRAAIVADPKDYRHCGYGAAVGGDPRCRRGISRVMGIEDWRDAANKYRMFILHRGCRKADGKRGSIHRDALLEAIKRGGKLPAAELLRLGVRHITDGIVFGSETFVKKVSDRIQGRIGRMAKTGPHSFDSLAGHALCTIRQSKPEVSRTS